MRVEAKYFVKPEAGDVDRVLSLPCKGEILIPGCTQLATEVRTVQLLPCDPLPHL